MKTTHKIFNDSQFEHQNLHPKHILSTVLSNIAMKRYHTCVINQEKNYTPMFDS